MSARLCTLVPDYTLKQRQLTFTPEAPPSSVVVPVALVAGDVVVDAVVTTGTPPAGDMVAVPVDAAETAGVGTTPACAGELIAGVAAAFIGGTGCGTVCGTGCGTGAIGGVIPGGGIPQPPGGTPGGTPYPP